MNKRSTYALVILFLINTFNFFDRLILSSVSKPIIEEWHLTDAQMGKLSFAFILMYAIAGVPLGIWADKASRVKIISLAVTIWSFFTAASGFAWNYSTLMIARLGVGIGEAGCAPAGNSLIGDMFPPHKRGRAMSIFMMGLPAGMILSFMLSGFIAKHWGWRSAFLLPAIPGLLLALLIWRLPEPERVQTGSNQQQFNLISCFRILKIPAMWLIIISGALHNFITYALTFFIPLYLGRIHGMPVDRASYSSAVIFGGGGALGLIVGGGLADWVRRKSISGRLIVAGVAALIAAPCIYYAFYLPKGSTTLFITLLASAWVMFYIYYVTVYPAIQDVVSEDLKGSAMALYFCGMYLLGGAYGPWILGILSDAYGLQQAFRFIPVVSIALALVLFGGSYIIFLTQRRKVAKRE